MENKKKKKKQNVFKPDFTPIVYYSGGNFEQIQDSLSMEIGRDKAREILSKW